MSTCPQCGSPSVDLVRVDPGMKLHVQTMPAFTGKAIPDAVCATCYATFSSSLSQGTLLRQQAAAKEHNRMMLWKSRVALVKQAKSMMAQRLFSDAAVSYEKYLRVLEIVYGKKSGELTPDVFKADGRQQEITVITSVYWDLMRIYDASPRYGERQKKAAEKLAEFARYTPIFPNIIRQAEIQTRTAKNPANYKKFLQLSNKQRPRCFISTAAFNYESSPTVFDLCRFRDEYLRKRTWGRAFIKTYYRYSPSIARALDRNPQLKPAVRLALRLAATCVNRLSA